MFFFHWGPPAFCDSGVARVFHFISRRLMLFWAANVFNREFDTAQLADWVSVSSSSINNRIHTKMGKFNSFETSLIHIFISKTKPQNTDVHAQASEEDCFLCVRLHKKRTGAEGRINKISFTGALRKCYFIHETGFSDPVSLICGLQ